MTVVDGYAGISLMTEAAIAQLWFTQTKYWFSPGDSHHWNVSQGTWLLLSGYFEADRSRLVFLLGNLDNCRISQQIKGSRQLARFLRQPDNLANWRVSCACQTILPIGEIHVPARESRQLARFLRQTENLANWRVPRISIPTRGS